MQRLKILQGICQKRRYNVAYITKYEKKKTKRYANMYDGDGSVYYKVDLSRQDIFFTNGAWAFKVEHCIWCRQRIIKVEKKKTTSPVQSADGYEWLFSDDAFV